MIVEPSTVSQDKFQHTQHPYQSPLNLLIILAKGNIFASFVETLLGIDVKRTCFNCGSESHPVHQCPHPVDFSRAAASQMRWLQTRNTHYAAHLVLAHLCNVLDDTIHEERQECNEGPDDDVKVFQQILGGSGWSGTEMQNTPVNVKLNKIEIFPLHVGLKPTTFKILGTCLDSGAQQSVFVRKQRDSYKRTVWESLAFSNIAEGKIKV